MLQAGQLQEVGPPTELLLRDGHFAGMVNGHNGQDIEEVEEETIGR